MSNDNVEVKRNFNKKTLFIVISIVLILIVIISIIFESSGSKLTIKNKSNLKLEYIKYYFVYEDGPIMEPIIFESLESMNNIYDYAPKANLSGVEANLEIRFKFEGHEPMFVDAGYFNDYFKGNINILFEQINADNIGLKVKAANGIIPSNTITCNEYYTINLLEGYVEG